MNTPTPAPPSRDIQLSSVFVALADSLVSGYDVVELMQRLTITCVELFTCDAAGLMLADAEGNLRVMASSDDQLRMLELFEVQNSDGPCLECFERGMPMSAPDLTAVADRWPMFVPAAQKLGCTAAEALPLRLRDVTIGALNLLFTNQEAMADDELVLAQALADVATIGILQQRAVHEQEVLAEQLQRALTSRLVIEQAKGVLAERGDIPIDQAFTFLRDYCRHHRVAISDTARELAEGRLNPRVVLNHNRPGRPRRW